MNTLKLWHKLGFSLLIALLVSGCNTTVESWELKTMIENCKDRGGIHSVNTFVSIGAICVDGVFAASKSKSN